MDKRVEHSSEAGLAVGEGVLMKLRAADRARAGSLWRYCAMSLVGLLIAMTLSACMSSHSSSCSGGTEDYQGNCLPHVTALYLKCIDGRGFSVSNQVSVGATLPQAAGTTFGLAYKRSKDEDKTVALQVVHDCLTLAEQTATSSADRGAARQYAQQAAQAINVVQNGLPAIETNPHPPETLNCGSADVNTSTTCKVTVNSTGIEKLHITGVEVTGANSDSFTPDGGCVGMWLDPHQNQSCTITVQFTPTLQGELNATLVIHQNLPAPDHGTPLQLVGTGTGTSTSTISPPPQVTTSPPPPP
jgi:hypothetical protein